LAAQQVRRQIETQSVFRQQPALPFDDDIVSVILDRQPWDSMTFGVPPSIMLMNSN